MSERCELERSGSPQPAARRPQLALSAIEVHRLDRGADDRRRIGQVVLLDLEVREVAVEAGDAAHGRDEVLEGDGYEDYVKPFRTVEDLHVMAASIGWVAQVMRRAEAPRQQLEALGELATSCFALALVEPLDAAVHVALGGAWRRFRALVSEMPWDRTDETTRTRFERDRALFDVAGSVRQQRLDMAWGRLGRLSMPG